MKEETVKDTKGRLLKQEDARKRWADHFENLLHVVEDREVDNSSGRCSSASDGSGK